MLFPGFFTIGFLTFDDILLNVAEHFAGIAGEAAGLDVRVGAELARDGGKVRLRLPWRELPVAAALAPCLPHRELAHLSPLLEI